ncbi:MAG: type II secretion system F family protein [Proteobacteria bacterium]|nr:type II secretion system F family protein [Pseudomonadota bacterium]
MQILLAVSIYVVAFLAVILAVYAVAQLVFSSGDRKGRINRRLSMLASGMDHQDVYSRLVRRAALSQSGGLLPRTYNRFCLACQQAGIEIAPRSIILGVLGLAGLLWLVSLSASRAASFSGGIANIAMTLVASLIISLTMAWLWISRRQANRMRLLEEQMPLALDVVNRALRAGHPVISAVQLAGNEMGDPIGSEFGLIVDETTYGSEFREALTNFARRTGSQDAHFFAVSVGIQADTGGNLAEILEGLAAVIRGRATLAKRVKALSSEGRASALLLSVLPILMISGLMLIHAEFYTAKFSDPIFWPTVGVIGVLYLIGWWMIHRIINFRY